MKLIEKHKEWMEKGEIDRLGLCCSIGEELQEKYYKLLQLFRPTDEQFSELWVKGYTTVFWASGLPSGSILSPHKYTTLRQNIVLLICAMEGELE